MEGTPEARAAWEGGEFRRGDREDADLYTRFDDAPTKSDYDCRPYKYGSKETCSHKKISGDTLYVMVRGWDPMSDFALEVAAPLPMTSKTTLGSAPARAAKSLLKPSR